MEIKTEKEVTPSTEPQPNKLTNMSINGNIYKRSDNNGKIQDKASNLDKKIVEALETFASGIEAPYEKVEIIYAESVEKIQNYEKPENFYHSLCEKHLDIDAEDIADILDFVQGQIELIDTDISLKEKIWKVTDTVAEKYNLICMKESRKLFMYQDGIYKSDSIEIDVEGYLAEHGEKMYGEHFVENDLKKCLHRIQYTRHVPEAEFNKNQNVIVLQNGLLNIDTLELRPHTKDEIYTSRFEYPYNSDAKLTEDFKNYLTTTFKGVEWEIEVFQELFGYLLSKECFIEVIFELLGDGGNGKGVIVNTMSSFVGHENVCALSMVDICGKDQFTIANLYGKTANLCGDIDKETIKQSGNIKKATGRDWINARYPYGQPFKFKNRAKLIFAGNAMPHFDDGTDAILQRLYILDFPNKFRQTDDEDNKLEEKLATAESLSGILTWALEGYHRLRKNGRFSYTKTEAEKIDMLNSRVNPVKIFIEDCIIEKPKLHVRKDKLYESYQRYAKQNNLPNQNINDFHKMFKVYCNELGIVTKEFQATEKVDGIKKKPRAYKDITLVKF